MEAIMRKLTAMALSMMFILGSVIPVGAEETQIRQTTISVSIDPVYTVTIPANTTIDTFKKVEVAITAPKPTS